MLKTMSEPRVRLVQTVHLSCTDTNTISKWKEVRFHLTQVTWEFHQVHPTRCLGLWYIQRKPGIYLASTLTLSPYEPKQDST